MHYYQHHIGDHARASAHLSNEEDLAFRRLKDWYAENERPIPLDIEWVSRRLRLETHWVSSVLKDFFNEMQDGWHLEEFDSIIEEFHKNCKKNKENGRKGGRPRNPVETHSVSTENPLGFQLVPSGNPVETLNHKPITVNQYPPLTPPPGGECLAEESENEENPAVSGSRKKPAVQLKTWLAQCRERGEKPVSGYKPVFEYAEKVGLPATFVELAWNEFYRRHGPGGSNESVKKSDWRRHFRNCVEGNWQKLWYVLPDGGFALTTNGIQAERAAA